MKTKRTKITFDALKGYQSGRIYYLINCPFTKVKDIFNESEDVAPAERSQRRLSENRATQIKSYIESNPENHTIPPIITSVTDVKFSPAISSEDKIGRLIINSDAEWSIIDGQHRIAALKCLEDKTSNKTIPVMIFPNQNTQDRQQRFSDINQNTVKPSRSLNLLYNNRSIWTALLKDLVEHVTIFNNADMERVSIPRSSDKTFALSAISDATKILLGTSHPSGGEITRAVEFWQTIQRYIPEWSLLLEKKITPQEMRDMSVCGHGNFLTTIAIVGTRITDWKRLRKLQTLDFSRNNDVWENKLVRDGKAIKRRAENELAADIIFSHCTEVKQ